MSWKDFSQHAYDWFVNNLVPASVTLQSAATAMGNGTPYTPTTNMELTFVITGAATARTIVFEMADPVKGVYVAWQAFRPADSTLASTTANGSDTAPETWQVSVPAGYSFRARISAITGSPVNVTGWAVA